MMKNSIALTTIALLFLGCGDDVRPVADTGAGDTDAADSSMPDGSGSVTSRTAMVRLIDQDDNPLEGVNETIDTDLGRFEGVSDAAGEVILDYRYMEDSTDFIAALEGYRIIARVDAAYEVPESADGFTEITLQELRPDFGAMVRVVAGATGVPTGGRWCVGLVSFFAPCQDEGVAWDQRVGVGRIEDTVQDYVYGYALDDAGALYDFARADWTVMPDGGRTVTLAFDGTLDETPMERDVIINYPSDPESPFRTEILDETWQGWLTATEPGTYLPRSALTMISAGADSITMRVHSFPIAGDELVWSAAPTIDPTDAVRTIRWFSTTPPDAPIDVLDLPRVRSGAVWTDEFEWTEPASDVDNYVLQFMNGAGVVAISVGTSNAFATVPPLPSGYDPTVSFPFPGAPGEAQVLALRGNIPPDDMATEPNRVDGEASWSPRSPMTF